jgi:replicative DNA helicase
LILDSFESDSDFERIENLFISLAPFYTGGFARGYANIILEMSIKHGLIKIGEEIVEQSLSARPDVDSIISNLEEATREIKTRWLKKQEVSDGK